MTFRFRFADWPLRLKVAVLLTAVSLLPLAIWVYVDLRQDRARLLDAMKDLLSARGDQIVRELDAFHRGYRRSVDSIARMPGALDHCAGSVRRDAQRDALRDMLAAHQGSDTEVRGAAFLDGAGRVVVATELPLEGADLGDRPAVREALSGRRVTSDPFLSSPRSGSVPTIAYMTPMVAAGNQVACVAVLWVHAEALWRTVKASNALAGPESFAVVFDRMGIRIAHTFSDDIVFRPAGALEPALLERLVAERRFGAKTRALLEDVRPFAEQYDRARADAPDPGVFRGFAPVNRAWTYGVARRLDTVPWTVFYMVPEVTAEAVIARATQERMILAAAVILGAAAVGAAFAGTIVRPVRNLARAAASIAGGDLAARVAHSHDDELGRLGASFNAMAERVEARTAELREARDLLERRVEERTAELTHAATLLQAEVGERERIAEVLGERDAALRRAHAMALLGHVVTRPDGSFESWSDTLPGLVGAVAGTMPISTRAWMDLLPDPDRETFRNAAIAAGRSGERTVVAYRIRRIDDGTLIHVRQVIEPIPGSAGPEGRMRWFSTLQDVTQIRRTELELRESQELLQAIVDNSGAVIYVKSLDGHYRLVNRRYLEIFGIPSEAVLGHTDHELFPKEVADALRDVDVRVAAGDGALIQEEVVPQGDGPHTYISVKCPLPGVDGTVQGIFGISTDITDRKRTEEALRASEEQTRLIVDTALDAVVTMDAKGCITGWNPCAEATFGWTRAEALGRPLASTIIPERQRASHRAGLERFLVTGQTSVMGRRIEVTALRRDGSEFPVDLAITQTRTGGDASFSAFVRDITDRRLAQERVRAQLDRMLLLDQITRAIAERQDLQSIYQVVVRSLEERLPVDFCCLCRYEPVDASLTVVHVGVRGQPLALELAMGEQARIEIDNNGLARPVQGELVHEPDISDTTFPFPRRLADVGLRSLVVAPLQSESRVFGLLVAARHQPDAFSSGDCEFLRQLSAHVALAARHAELHSALQQAYDDLRQSQQVVVQQERLRALGQMASGIAHDINNAISPVSLYTESLLERETQLSERGRGHLMTIARAVDDVATTVARMREFYRQREPRLALEAVKMNVVVQQVIDLTRVRWTDMPQQSGAVIDLNVDFAAELPSILGVDSELREALINLVLNAVDAMPEGGTLTLRTRALVDSVRVEVGDSGVGMDEETRRRCLEPFFTTKGDRGTGLGLAMVYGVLQRHGADIDIESAVGVGTTVRLSFPVRTTAEAAASPASAALPPRLSILVVDDDPMLLESLRETLEADGHFVATANGGQAGLDAFAAASASRRRFDIVITDLGMPHVDGRKVAAAVKAAGETPVIMLTGWGQRLASEDQIPPHVDHMLSKPPKLRELRAALSQLAAGTGETRSRAHT